MVELKCDRCDAVLPPCHYELFHYSEDDEGYDIELGYDFCSFKCLDAQVEIWRLEAALHG